MEFDVIIKNATVYDGCGNKPYNKDIAIKSGKIKVIGDISNAIGKTVIDAHNKVLCPGFIDVHSHADLVIHRENHHKILEPLLRQGITTFVGGNCGIGLAPYLDNNKSTALQYLEAMTGESQDSFIKWNTIKELFDILNQQGMVLNCGFLVPHGLLRIAAKGLENKTASDDEIKIMKNLLEEGLDAGALGMSTGLMYVPGLASDENELLQLAKILTPKDAVFTSHIRSYSNTLQQAIDELITISKKTGTRIQISHLFWLPHINLIIDRFTQSLLRVGAEIYKYIKLPLPLDIAMKQKMDYLGEIIKEGIPLGIDAMPTGTGFTHALAFFPPWSLEGGHEKIIKRIANKTIRKQIYQSIKNGKSIWPHRGRDTWSMNFFKVMGFQSVYLMSVVSEKNKQYEGKHFLQIASERKQHPFDAVCDILIEENGRVLVFETPTYPGDEFAERGGYAAICDPNVSIATDTILIGFGKPSHLFYDCYPKLMAKYVRKEKLLSLEEAIRKATSLPASQLCIKNRGIIKKGNWADLVIFDPNTICSHSTPMEPDNFPDGVEYVMVNGHLAVTPEGYFPEPRSGQIITRF